MLLQRALCGHTRGRFAQPWVCAMLAELPCRPAALCPGAVLLGDPFPHSSY